MVAGSLHIQRHITFSVNTVMLHTVTNNLNSCAKYFNMSGSGYNEELGDLYNHLVM